jgi:hypothetical protein
MGVPPDDDYAAFLQSLYPRLLGHALYQQTTTANLAFSWVVGGATTD